MHIKCWLTYATMKYHISVINYITTGSVFNGQQEATLIVDPTILLKDSTYTCQVVSTRYPGSEHARTEAQLNVYS